MHITHWQVHLNQISLIYITPYNTSYLPVKVSTKAVQPLHRLAGQTDSQKRIDVKMNIYI